MVRISRRSVGIAIVLYLTLIVIHVLFVRPWYLRCGATDAEIATPLAGDRFIAPTAVTSTRAITIAAPASVVWSWLVQIGQGRGGFYSHHWLENLFAANMHNAGLIEPALQHLHVGDRIVLQENGPSIRVTLVDPGRELSLNGWTFALRPVDGHTTRLVIRYAYDYSTSFAERIYYYAIFEPAHFVMEYGMMLGIAQRAEQSYGASVNAGQTEDVR
jgi:hypothetical protein